MITRKLDYKIVAKGEYMEFLNYLSKLNSVSDAILFGNLREEALKITVKRLKTRWLFIIVEIRFVRFNSFLIPYAGTT